MKCKIVQFDDEWVNSRRLKEGLFHGKDMRRDDLVDVDQMLFAETFFEEVFFRVELRDEVGFVVGATESADFLFERLGLDIEFWDHIVEKYIYDALRTGKEVMLLALNNEPGYGDNTCTLEIDETI